MATIFSKIVNGEIPSYKVAEDDYFFAFLDIHPLAKGHTLIVTKTEIDYLFDLNDELYKKMLVFSKRLAKSLEKVIDCQRVGMAVVGLEIPHAHIHLIPLNSMDDMDFKRQPLQLSKEEFIVIAAQINQAFEELV
ncbi:MAG: HIT family protein [Bacteroidetes bacterium]|nr:HIT family protein [Bacteroidota bacterium]